MNVNEFEGSLREELKNLNVLLLDVYTRRKYLCVDWSFDSGRKFTSCYSIQDQYLQNKTEEVLYKIVKNILYALQNADNIVGEIIEIKRGKK